MSCFILGDATILEESEKIKAQPTDSNTIYLFDLFNKLYLSESTRQLRSRTENDDDDDQMETNSSADNNDMYARAREKHARAAQREHQHDVKEEPITDEIVKPIQSKSTAVKVRRINDESTQQFDDEQIEMGVGLSNKKNKTEKKEETKIDTKENDLAITMPIANEKKRQAQETRIERIQRLCEKRTVGDVLDMAKQAYVERQQKRQLYKDYIERIES